MTAPLLRVSVVGGERRTDLVVPPGLPVAELVPGLARRLSLVTYDGLRLCTLDGRVLDDAAGLDAQDVPDGSVLALTPEPPPSRPVDDVAEAVRPPPAEGWPVDLPSSVAAVLFGLGAVALAAAGEPRAAAVVALGLTSAALTRRTGAAVAVTGAAASGYAAVAAARLAADARPSAGVAWAGGGGAALAVAALVVAALPAYRLRLLPVLLVSVAAAIVGAARSLRDVPLAVVSAVLLVAVVLAAAALPWVAVGRLARPRAHVDVARLDDEVRVARELLGGLALGLAVVEVALAPVVAGLGPAGVALAGCACTLTLLRARHHAAAAEALPAVVAGAAGLLAVAAAALWLHEAWRPAGGVVLAGVGGVLALAPRASPDAPLAAAALRFAETGCLVALLPLLTLATGALGLLP